MNNKSILVFLVIFVNFNFFAQEAKIIIKKENYELGEAALVKFEFNSNKNYDSIQAPDFLNFNAKQVSKLNSFVKGHEYIRSETLLYKLQPIDEGKLKIDSFIYYCNGNKIQAEPVIINVEASNEQRVIKKQFKKYLSCIISKDFSTAMDYVTPELFDIIPKSQMIKFMEQTFNPSDADLEIKDPSVLEIEKLKKIDNKYYSQIKYSLDTNMEFKDDPFETDDVDERKMLVNLTKLILEKQYGKNNVNIDEKNNLFKVKSIAKAYAVSDSSKRNWKFIALDEKNKMILEKLLPKELVQVD